MLLSPDAYRAADQQFRSAFDLLTASLSEEAINDVRRYLNHAEIELAYESLGLSLRAENVSIPEEAKQLLFPLGITLGFDRESILDAAFWENMAPLLRP